MQLFALDQENNSVSARRAGKGSDYLCMECRGIVRVRGGIHRQDHFYHLYPSSDCRQSGKSMPHLQTQHFIYGQLPDGECQLECRFPSINRIADAAWHKPKIVFEVQCSPISLSEVRERNRAYRSIGYEPVWLLHDSRFNQWKLSAAEFYLLNSTHFFTDMDAEGRGCIYDHYSLINNGVRTERLERLPIHISMPYIIKDAACLEARNNWRVGFEGDLLDCLEGREEWKRKILEWNKAGEPARAPLLNMIWERWMQRPYRLLFQLLLEKACR